MNRRSFLITSTASAFTQAYAAGPKFDIAAFDRARVLRNAKSYLGSKPETVTSATSPRSTGGPHDFFSEGDYWWPDPKNPNGPYIRKDGMTNPDNFVRHRQFLMKLSVQVPALAAAWKLTHDKRYTDHAATHVRAWFLDPATRMNPNLELAQAIHGLYTGRGTGVIDTIHLVEVARAIPLLHQSGSLSNAHDEAVRSWFDDYTTWMTTSKNGIEERDAVQNHGTCWLMQVMAFAALTGNKPLIADCATRFKKNVVKGQIEPDGSMPLELRRTKPYGYSLFNLEAIATVCQMAAESGLDLWNYSTPDGRSVAKAIEYMFPYMRDKKSWTHEPDVMYFDQWPMRQASLLFGGLAYKRADYLDLWKTLPADSDVDEVIRNFPIRQPVLWV